MLSFFFLPFGFFLFLILLFIIYLFSYIHYSILHKLMPSWYTHMSWFLRIWGNVIYEWKWIEFHSSCSAILPAAAPAFSHRPHHPPTKPLKTSQSEGVAAVNRFALERNINNRLIIRVYNKAMISMMLMIE